MKTPTILGDTVACISDLHLGVHQDSVIFHKTAIQFAETLKTTLLKRGIKDIVISGDVHHDRSEVSVNTLQVAYEFFTILKPFNIIILVGNHDAYYKDRSDVNSISIFNGWDNITILSDVTTIQAFGKTLTFCPWASELTNIPKSDALFGHFEISSFKMSKTKVCMGGTKSEDLLDKAPLIITGHFHLREERTYSKGTILYLGCPYEMDWGDSGTTKGVHLLNLQDMSFEFVENTFSPKHKKFKLSDLLGNGSALSTLKAEVPGHFISFIVDKKITTDKIEAFINRLNLLKPLSIKVDYSLENQFVHEEAVFDFEGIDIPTAIEEFINMLDIPNKQDIIKYTLELYSRVS